MGIMYIDSIFLDLFMHIFKGRPSYLRNCSYLTGKISPNAFTAQ